MKKIWNKIPAWAKALLLLLVTLMPANIAVQSALLFNLQLNTSKAWAVFVAIPIWLIYWFLIKKYDTFKEENDVKLEWRFNLRNTKAWYRMIAMICLTWGLIQVVEILFQVEPTEQVALLQQFKSVNPWVGIPLLLVLSINAGFLEELVFRGFLQNTLRRSYGIWIAVIGVGFLFAVIHQLPLLLILPYMLVSMGYSLVAQEMKSTAPGMWGHLTFDFVMIMNIYFDVIPLNSTPALILSIALVIAGLFFLLRGNKAIWTKGIDASELATVRTR